MRRVIHGVARDGYRLKSESLGDSLRDVSTWIGADPKSGLPRWIAVDSEAESVLVELETLARKETARPADLPPRRAAGHAGGAARSAGPPGEGSRGGIALTAF